MYNYSIKYSIKTNKIKIMSIELTQSAVNKIKSLLQNESNKNLRLRISVEVGGCFGLRYRYELCEGQKNEIVNYGDVEILVDDMSKSFVNGSIVDYIDALENSYFTVINPNAKGKCGCGKSFDT